MDMTVIAYGILVLMVIIAAIITFYPIHYPLSYPEWYNEVKNEFYLRGFASDYANHFDIRMWKDFFEEGLSPKEAVDAYLKS